MAMTGGTDYMIMSLPTQNYVMDVLVLRNILEVHNARIEY